MSLKCQTSSITISLHFSGLKESLWENAVFHVTFHFSEHYNEEAPEVVFNTIPFHPNGNFDWSFDRTYKLSKLV